MNQDKASFPTVGTFCVDSFTGKTTTNYISEGTTKREHAAITMRVPNSGDEHIDAMIRQANRRDAAVAAMQGLLTAGHGEEVEIACDAVTYADALLARLEEKP